LSRGGQNALAQGGDLLDPRQQRRADGKLRLVTHLRLIAHAGQHEQ
jgi:hypothetical protein